MLFIIFIVLSYNRYARKYGLTDETAKRRFSSAVSALVLTIAASYAGAYATGALITVAATEFNALTEIYHALQDDGIDSRILSTIVAAPTTILATIYVPKFVVFYATRHLRNIPHEFTNHQPAEPVRETKFPTAIVTVAILCAISGAALATAIFMMAGSNGTQPERPVAHIPAATPLLTVTPTLAQPTPFALPIPTIELFTMPTLQPLATIAPPPTIIRKTHLHPIPLDHTDETVAAFASCGGLYTGQQVQDRADAARSTLRNGYRTLDQLRELVHANCGVTLPQGNQTQTQSHHAHVYLEAYASCNGQYHGTIKADRYSTTKAALDSGYQTLGDLIAIVDRRCPGTVLQAANSDISTTVPQAPTPTRPPLPTPTPTPTPPLADLHQLKELMLELTNAERVKAGIPPVSLGHNPAAQLHVEAALQGCYSSHWDRWGLKPNHRYTLTGGTGADRENLSGSDYCIKESENYRSIQSMEQEVRDTIQGWMDSPGHRRNLLDPAHTELNVGISHDRYNTVMAQHFSSDYVRYQQKPEIDQHGSLVLEATVSAATLDLTKAVNVQIAYDPPPQPLTRGQLSYTYSLCNPIPIAYVVKPLKPGWTFTDPPATSRTLPRRCVDPYDTPPNRPPPQNHPEANQQWAAAKRASSQASDITVRRTRIIADSMTLTSSHIKLNADISEVLNANGPGIYTILLWGRPDHMMDPTPLSKQSIFWNTQPPAGAPY